MKYECTVIFDASSSVSVEADTPEEAAQLAEDMVQGNQTLCHQCSNDLNTGDSIGVHVYNEECTEELLDTTYRGNPPQRKPLTHEQRFDLLTKFEPHKNKWEAPAILIDMVEAAHGIKE